MNDIIVGVLNILKSKRINGLYAHSIALIIMGGGASREVAMNIIGWWMEHTWVSFSSTH